VFLSLQDHNPTKFDPTTHWSQDWIQKTLSLPPCKMEEAQEVWGRAYIVVYYNHENNGFTELYRNTLLMYTAFISKDLAAYNQATGLENRHLRLYLTDGLGWPFLFLTDIAGGGEGKNYLVVLCKSLKIDHRTNHRNLTVHIFIITILFPWSSFRIQEKS